MNSKPECEQTLLVQADFDGELDAAQAAALVRHREECAECRAVQEKLVRARTLLRAAPRYGSSSELRARLSGALAEAAAAQPREGARLSVVARPSDGAVWAGGGRSDDEARLAGSARSSDGASSAEGARSSDGASSAEGARSSDGASLADGSHSRGGIAGARGDDATSPRWRSPPRASRRPWAWSSGWAAAAAVVLASVIFFVVPRPTDVSAQLVNNHVRAMQLDSHLIDVVSTDHHTVKPWFAGKVDFAPPVKQLDADGYVLKGGRIDVVDARTAAVLVYQAGRHTVEVFIWPAGPASATSFQSEQLNGFNLRHWKDTSFEVWCVSDMAAEELDKFASRWRAAT